MKIHYIHQYFKTPAEGGGTRSYHLAKGLVDAGIEVEMVTTHEKHEYDFKLIEGIKVHYLPVGYQQHFGFMRRIWAFLTFVRMAKNLITKLPRPDYFYITSTPLTTGWIGLWAKKKFAVPYIFEVRDLWPDAPIQVGVIKNPLVKRLLYYFERKIYRNAFKIVALSPGIANAIRKRCPDCKINLVPNFADTEFFKPIEKQDDVFEKLGLSNKFTIAYAGAIGKVNAVNEILILAGMAKERNLELQFVVMGKGTHVNELLMESKKLRLPNFHYLPFGNKEKVKELLSVSDMAFVSFAHLPVLKTNSPNKFFDALAAGKAILVNHKGWVHDLVRQYGLGYYFNPEKPSEVLEMIQQLSENPQLLKKHQTNSRQLAENYFSKEIAILRLLAVIDPEKYNREFKDEVYILTA
ncbi:glycosyltransferase family 4 protein [Aquiflexum lacus]|uniref:glycosyltransferase family 4 protein n=1 Tax=Aquiflexum lacus TaxID=2483805 RepID=UPI001895A39F|nr:glycosyltransferase family 4 protein [Aquiflexum lacus]